MTTTSAPLPTIRTLAKITAVAEALGACPISIIDPSTSFEAFLIEGSRNPSAYCFAIVNGTTARIMVANSSAPYRLAFVAVETAPLVCKCLGFCHCDAPA
jgi:hypothetical protein